MPFSNEFFSLHLFFAFLFSLFLFLLCLDGSVTTCKPYSIQSYVMFTYSPEKSDGKCYVSVLGI